MNIDLRKLPDILYKHRYVLLYDFDIDLIFKLFKEYGSVIRIKYPNYPKHIMKIIVHYFHLDYNYKDITSKSLDFIIDLFKNHFIQYYDETQKYLFKDLNFEGFVEYEKAEFIDDSIILIFDNFDKIKINSIPVFETFFELKNVYIIANTYSDEYQYEINKLIISNFYELNSNEIIAIDITQPFFILVALILGAMYFSISYTLTHNISAFVILGAIWISTSWYKFENYFVKR